MPMQAPTPIARWDQMVALGGLPFATCYPSMRERNIGIQALWGLTTVVKQPGGKAAGALKPSHMGIFNLLFLGFYLHLGMF